MSGREAFAWRIGGRNWWGIRQLLFCNYLHPQTGETPLSLSANKLRLFLFLLPQLINSASVFSSPLPFIPSCFSVVGDAGGENSSDSSSLSSSLLLLVSPLLFFFVAPRKRSKFSSGSHKTEGGERRKEASRKGA